MPSRFVRTLFALVLAAGVLAGTFSAAQDAGSGTAPVAETGRGDLTGHTHDEKSLLPTTDISNELGRRLRQLDAQVVCACPTEKWTRTLLSCPDSCADPQKAEVRTKVAEGQSDDEIMAFMRDKYGPRVLASPDNAWTYRAPFIILAVAATVAMLVLWSWKRSGVAERIRQAEIASVEIVSDQEIGQIERELEGLE